MLQRSCFSYTPESVWGRYKCFHFLAYKVFLRRELPRWPGPSQPFSSFNKDSQLCIDISLPLPFESPKPLLSKLGRMLVRPTLAVLLLSGTYAHEKRSEGMDPFLFGWGGTDCSSFPCHSNPVRIPLASLQKISKLRIHTVQL